MTTTDTHTSATRPGARPTGQESRLPGLLALMVAVLGFISAAGALAPGVTLIWDQDSFLGWLAIIADIQPNLAWAAVLFLIAGGLALRKRAAWWLVMLNTAYYVLLDVVSVVDQDWVFIGPLVLHMALAAVLIRGYREFSARVRGGALVVAIGAFMATLAVGVLIGWALLSAFPGTVPEENHLAWALAQVAGIGIADPSSYVGEPPAWVVTTLTSFASIGLIVFVIVLLRSRRTASSLSGTDEKALRALLDVYGEHDSLAYFATRRDKSVIFSADGRAAIAYRVEMSVCLAAGDPIGDRASWDDAITAWLDAAATFGWVPAVIGASKDGATAYRRRGMSVLALGDEAIIDTRTFSLRGPHMAPVRQAVTRATRAGATVRLRFSRDIPAAELDHLRELADVWRAGEDERGFSMALGRLGDPSDPSDPDCVIVEALMPAAPEPTTAPAQGGATPGDASGATRADVVSTDPGERVVAILSFVPWGRTGLSLDLMRRSPQAPSGTFELLVSDLCRRSDELGIRRLSLNFAMFRSAFEAGEQLGAGPVARMWRRILRFLSRWWQLESLYKANEKYDPAWSPRMLCYSDTRYLPQIGVAVGVAEGFLRGGATPRRSWWGSLGTVPSNAPVEPIALEPPVVARPRPEQVRVRLAKADRLAAPGRRAVARRRGSDAHDRPGAPRAGGAAAERGAHAERGARADRLARDAAGRAGRRAGTRLGRAYRRAAVGDPRLRRRRLRRLARLDR